MDRPIYELQNRHFAILGVGNIGRILVARLLEAGVRKDCLGVYDSNPEALTRASQDFGLAEFHPTAETMGGVDVFLLAASPKAVPEILQSLSAGLRAGQMVVSFAAAIPLSRLEAVVPQGVQVARVMPNAPSLVGEGMNPVVYSKAVTPEGRATIKALLSTLGRTIEVRDEQMNWCVGLSGAAMRSMLPALEGMTRAGVEAGLAEKEARQVAAAVMLGTARLALNTDLSFVEIKALTPMQTLDEAHLAQLLEEAARTAKEKIDLLQEKLATS